MDGRDNIGEIWSPDSGDPSWAASPGDEVGDSPPVEEVVERQLAQYAFVREDRDREVRLLFRDTSPFEIARAFRMAGAYLITLMSERAHAREDSKPQPDSTEVPEEHEDIEMAHRKHGPRARPASYEPAGEAIFRYFYNLGETVYTVSIVSSTGVVESVSGLYPAAARLEREVGKRAAVVFRPGVGAL